MRSARKNLTAGVSGLGARIAGGGVGMLGMLVFLSMIPGGCGKDEGAAYREALAKVTPEALADELIARGGSIEYQRKIVELKPDDKSLSEEGRDLGEEVRTKGGKGAANNLPGVAKEVVAKFSKVEGMTREEVLAKVVSLVEASKTLNPKVKADVVKHVKEEAAKPAQ